MASKAGVYGWTRPGYRGLCIRCHKPFIGKGDRCPNCTDDLRVRRKRKRR